MKGRITEMVLSLTGKQRVTLELTEDFREEYDRLKDEEVEVTIGKYHKRRSLDANAYFWVLCHRLAEATGQPKNEIYRAAIKEIGGSATVVCIQEQAAQMMREGWKHNGLGWVTDTLPSKLPGCVNMVLYYGSSTYNSAQMSRLIDNIIQDCKAVGIETLPPEELARLKAEWRN